MRVFPRSNMTVANVCECVCVCVCVCVSARLKYCVYVGNLICVTSFQMKQQWRCSGETARVTLLDGLARLLSENLSIVILKGLSFFSFLFLPLSLFSS